MKYRIIAMMVIFITFIVSATLLIITNNININERVSSNKNLGRDQEPSHPFLQPKMNPVWDRENAFLVDNLYFRQGLGYELKLENSSFSTINPKSIKVLIFGDSFTWGHGLIDPTTDLSARLSDSLNKEAGGSTIFSVIPFAKSGASTWDYIDNLTERKLKAINPDIIIYNFTYNDVVPNFTESMICGFAPGDRCSITLAKDNPTYKKCINGGDDDFISKFIKNTLSIHFRSISYNLLIRKCEPLYKKLEKESYDEEKMGSDVRNNPFLGSWLEAIKIIKKRAGDRPIYVNHMRVSIDKKTTSDIIDNYFKEAGFKLISNKIIDSYINKYGYADIAVNKGNAHYSELAGALYAQDTKNAIYSDIKPSRMIEARKGDAKIIYDLVSSTVPYNMNVKKINENSYNIELKKMLEKDRYVQNIAGRPVPMQNAMCLNLGYANVGINLNRRDIGGQTLSLREVKYKDQDPLSLTLMYYDENFITKYIDLGLIGKLNTFKIPDKAKGATILITDKRKICDINKELYFNEFEYNLTQE